MNQTEDIKELVIALSKAQGKMKPAIFNRQNPHFKNKYADFTSCMDACREHLSENGLSIMQFCETLNDKLMLVTMLAHISGQWIKSYFPLNPKNSDSQSIGSAMTYAKRYSLSAMLGIVSDEDDDGEAAVGRQAKTEPNRVSAKIEKIDASQVETLKQLEEKLDMDTKKKIQTRMINSFNTHSFEDILVKNFLEIKQTLENAVKFVEQKKVELTHA